MNFIKKKKKILIFCKTILLAVRRQSVKNMLALDETLNTVVK